jgi:formylglycine-generating enzyme required for sulfatase activity
MRCAKCGQENSQVARFCAACGAVFSEAGGARGDGGGGAEVSRTSEMTNAENTERLDAYHFTVTSPSRSVGPGKLIADRYRIVNRVGSGGMGDVYQATDTELSGLTVAIKVLPPLLARHAPSIEALKREAAIALRLTHPNICRLHNFHSDGEIKFLVMEYLSGQTLEALLATRPSHKMTWEELRPVAEQIGAALDFAHSLNPPILHGDIKPANIMVMTDGTAKLLDFGIAREMRTSLTRITGREETSGTVPYMSPEQFRGENLDGRADLYSFSAVLYEALAGRPLVNPGGSLGWQIQEKMFEPLSGQSDSVNAILAAGLNKSATERPTSFRAIMEGGRKPAPVAEPPKPPVAQPTTFDEAPPFTPMPIPVASPPVVAPVPTSAPRRRDWKLVAVGLGLVAIVLLAVAAVGIANRRTLSDAEIALRDGRPEQALNTLQSLYPLIYSSSRVAEIRRQADAQIQGAQTLADSEHQKTEALTAAKAASDAQQRARDANAVLDAPTQWQQGEADTKQAKTHFDAGRYAEARTTYEQATKDYQQALTQAGKIAGERSQAAAAEADAVNFQRRARDAKAAQDAPAQWQQAEAALSQAKSYVDARRYGDARTAYEQAAKGYQDALAQCQKTTALAAQKEANDRNKEAEQAKVPTERPMAWIQANDVMTEAGDHLRAGRYDLAKDAYLRAVTLFHDATVEVQNAGKVKEDAALKAKADYETELKRFNQAELASLAPRDWAKVQDAVKAAVDAGTDWKTAQFKYDEARGLLPAVVAAVQNEKVHQEAVKAKADYTTALAAADQSRLNQYGGSAWQNVRQAVAAAENAGQDWRTVAQRYQEAKALLATADRAAVAGTRQKEIADLLATANVNDTPDTRKKALDALEQVLKLDPQNKEALALKERLAKSDVPESLRAPFDAKTAKSAQQRWADHLGKELVITNKVGVKLTLIPPGTFMMGTPDNEADREDDEGPQHQVTLTKAFYLGVTEVTQAQWKAIMGEANNPSEFKGDDLPVEQVSWREVTDFCIRLSQKENRKYRLPTEAEWEYACRAGVQGAYSSGNSEEALKQVGWYSAISDDKSHPVGQKTANAWGLFDMHGNVWEWCGDWYEAEYPAKVLTDPTGPSDTTDERTLRGGSWWDEAGLCRAGKRNMNAEDEKYNTVGFRVVLEVN